MRAAFEAVRKLKGHPDSEVRDALHAELTARGITDVAPANLDPLVDAVLRGPRRAFLSGTWSWLVEARGELRDMRAHSLPSWTNPPNRAQRLEWREDRGMVQPVVELDPKAVPIVDRLLKEVPEIYGESADGGKIVARIFSCWVIVGPADDAAGTLTVHVGKHVLGRLPAKDCVVVREILAAGRHAALQFDAGVVDRDPPFIDVALPDRV
jgi:hypothetical protein